MANQKTTVTDLDELMSFVAKREAEREAAKASNAKAEGTGSPRGGKKLEGEELQKAIDKTAEQVSNALDKVLEAVSEEDSTTLEIVLPAFMALQTGTQYASVHLSRLVPLVAGQLGIKRQDRDLVYHYDKATKEQSGLLAGLIERGVFENKWAGGPAVCIAGSIPSRSTTPVTDAMLDTQADDIKSRLAAIKARRSKKE